MHIRSRFFCTRAICAALICVGLAGCFGREPVREIPSVDEEAAQLQVYPLQNPAVQRLRDQSLAQRENGQVGDAMRTLSEALALAPRDPLLLQDMAELKLLDGKYRQADRLARESWDLGPRVGPLCERNWNTVALAAPRIGDQHGAWEAADQLPRCKLPPVLHVDDQVP